MIDQNVLNTIEYFRITLLVITSLSMGTSGASFIIARLRSSHPIFMRLSSSLGALFSLMSIAFLISVKTFDYVNYEAITNQILTNLMINTFILLVVTLVSLGGAVGSVQFIKTATINGKLLLSEVKDNNTKKTN